ncbi:MAG: hypothetical protein ROY99_12765 [Ignavibacterium sp.]|nr:hypothetical protein [Ignavibacterium sp.]
MKKNTFSLFVFCFIVFLPQIIFVQGDQLLSQNFQFEVPELIQSLQQKIKQSEQNKDWDLYYSLKS